MSEIAPHFESALVKLDYLNPEKFQLIIDQVQQCWMSELAKEFVFSLFRETLEQLQCM